MGVAAAAARHKNVHLKTAQKTRKTGGRQDRTTQNHNHITTQKKTLLLAGVRTTLVDLEACYKIHHC